MSVRIPLDSMTVDEKLSVMEEIWADLSRKPDNVPSPDWHRDVLSERERKHADGSISYSDWTDAKKRIRKKIT